MTILDRLIRQAWPILREAIRMGRTVTYTELAGRGGPPLNRRNLHRQLLIPLGERCRAAGLPDLPALVVRKDSGKPGIGWHVPHPSVDPDRAWAEALEYCLQFNWPREVPVALLDDASNDQKSKLT